MSSSNSRICQDEAAWTIAGPRQDISVQPTQLDFGSFSLHEQRRLKLCVANTSSRTIHFFGLRTVNFNPNVGDLLICIPSAAPVDGADERRELEAELSSETSGLAEELVVEHDHCDGSFATSSEYLFKLGQTYHVNVSLREAESCCLLVTIHAKAIGKFNDASLQLELDSGVQNIPVYAEVVDNLPPLPVTMPQSFLLGLTCWKAIFAALEPEDNVVCMLLHSLITEIAKCQVADQLSMPKKGGVFCLQWRSILADKAYEDRCERRGLAISMRWTVPTNVDNDSSVQQQLVESIQRKVDLQLEIIQNHMQHYGGDDESYKIRTLIINVRFLINLPELLLGYENLSASLIDTVNNWARTIYMLTQRCSDTIANLIIVDAQCYRRDEASANAKKLQPFDWAQLQEVIEKKEQKKQNFVLLPIDFAYRQLRIDSILAACKHLRILFLPQISEYERSFALGENAGRNPWSALEELPLHARLSTVDRLVVPTTRLEDLFRGLGAAGNAQQPPTKAAKFFCTLPDLPAFKGDLETFTCGKEGMFRAPGDVMNQYEAENQIELHKKTAFCNAEARVAMHSDSFWGEYGNAHAFMAKYAEITDVDAEQTQISLAFLEKRVLEYRRSLDSYATRRRFYLYVASDRVSPSCLQLLLSLLARHSVKVRLLSSNMCYDEVDRGYFLDAETFFSYWSLARPAFAQQQQIMQNTRIRLEFYLPIMKINQKNFTLCRDQFLLANDVCLPPTTIRYTILSEDSKRFDCTRFGLCLSTRYALTQRKFIQKMLKILVRYLCAMLSDATEASRQVAAKSKDGNNNYYRREIYQHVDKLEFVFFKLKLGAKQYRKVERCLMQKSVRCICKDHDGHEVVEKCCLRDLLKSWMPQFRRVHVFETDEL